MHAHHDFDPRDPLAASGHNPLRAFTETPRGIGAIAFLQALLAVMAAYSALRTRMDGASLVSVTFASLGMLLGASAYGLWRCSAWGWWLVATIYFFLFFQFIVDVSMWAGGRIQIKPALTLIALGAEIAILYYLQQPHVLRHIRFRHVPPQPVVRWSPVAVGLALATMAAIRNLRQDVP